jgi:hypothetical protein
MEVFDPASTRDSTLHYIAEHFFIATLHGPRRKHSLYCLGGVFTGPLPINERPSVKRVRFAGMCLPGRFLVMGIHVTMFTVTINKNKYPWSGSIVWLSAQEVGTQTHGLIYIPLLD